MTNEEKAKVLSQYFFIAGFGNFDVTIDEISEIFDILDGENAKTKLKDIYERLEKQRMG